MGLKAGYKQTEVGIIPEDWEVKLLGDISTIGSGGTPSRKIPNYWNGDIPWITTTQINFNSINEASEFITKKGLDNSAAKIYSSGTLLMAMYGQGKTRGKVAVLGIDATINQACAAIGLTKDVHSPYIFFNLTSRYEEIRGLSNTGNQENLNSNIIKNIAIPLPPLEEQEAIAGILSDVDALLTALDRLIAKKEAMKQGTMQALLTGQVRLPAFAGNGERKQTVLGKMPAGWEVKPLVDITILCREHVIPANFPDQIFTHFSLPAFDYDKMPVQELGSDIGSNKFRVQQNTVLISKLNPRIPRVWLPTNIPNNSIASTEFLVLQPTQRINREFLFVVCSSPSFCAKMDLIATGTTSSHQRISPKDVLKIEIPLPPLEEQHAIAGILSDMDAELSALRQRHHKTTALKQALMQSLLTGAIRLQ